jgi:recombination protein RecT
MTKKDKPDNAPAVKKKPTVVEIVAAKVQGFCQRGELTLPENYVPDNALKAAWLVLQEVKGKGGAPALSTTTPESQALALLDMIVQGLNPAKKQLYFIVYGNKLVCQRSYFGTMAVAKMVDSRISEIFAEVVYDGDTLKYRIDNGQRHITTHEQDLDNIDKANIKAAYCVILDQQGQPLKTELMTMEEIKQSWKQSQMKPVNDAGAISANSTHGKFTADMAKKTVINRACKMIINSADDSHLKPVLKEAVNRAHEIADEAEIEAEIEDNANTGPVVSIANSTAESGDNKYSDVVESGPGDENTPTDIDEGPPPDTETADQFEGRKPGF